MDISSKYLEISSFEGEGYRPLVDYHEWRVAVLRYIDELEVHQIRKMQRHDDTDEVFVLLEGRCILFIGEGQQAVSRIQAVDMEPLKFYNIKRSCWHTHTLREGTTVLIVENRDTGDHNSPEIDLDSGQQDRLVELTAQYWS